MAGSSIAAPSAAAWVTDFSNAAYYARDAQEREVDDLRLAWCILTTRWASPRSAGAPWRAPRSRSLFTARG